VLVNYEVPVKTETLFKRTEHFSTLIQPTNWYYLSRLL